jgi:hypothetical protein
MPGAGIGLASEGRSKLRGEAPSEPGFPGCLSLRCRPPCKTALSNLA